MTQHEDASRGQVMRTSQALGFGLATMRTGKGLGFRIYGLGFGLTHPEDTPQVA